MSTVLIHAPQRAERWRQALAQAVPDLDFVTADDDYEPAAIKALVGWNPPAGLFAALTNLQVMFAMGAGVDGLLKRADLPARVELVRLLDAGMAEQMVEYALCGVLMWQRHLLDYADQQAQALWNPLRRRSRRNTRVGVLGLGALGGEVARALAEFGYPVAGWSRSAKALPGIRCEQGEDGLRAMLQTSDVLVNLLPSTAQTRGLLDAQRLSWLPAGALLVNASRGDQLDAAALCERLDSGALGAALLDVFASEPLPADSPLWRHSRVRITPHVAALTVLEESAAQIAANLQRWQRGEALLGRVERERGY